MYNPTTTTTVIKSNQNSSNPQGVLVFGSNIDNEYKIEAVKEALQHLSGVTDISVDLENWERVLRVECTPEITPWMVLINVWNAGFRCYELES